MGASNCLITAGTYQNSLMTMGHATAAKKPAKKFHILHQRNFRKAADISEYGSPAENSVVAAAHSQQESCVMRKAVGQSINEAWREQNPEVDAHDFGIIHYACTFIQTSFRNLGIHMHKPKHVPVGSARACVHLDGPTPVAYDQLIAKIRRQLGRAIGAAAIDHDNFGPRRPSAQMVKKRADQRRLVADRNNDRELQLHSNIFLQSLSGGKS